MKTKFYSVLVLGMISVGIASILIRLCNASPLVIAAYRMTLSALMIFPIFAVSGLRETKQKKNEIIKFIPLGALLSVHFILWIYSLSYTSVMSSTVLVTTNPIFVLIMSFLFFKEKTSKKLLAGILVSFVGSILIALSSRNAGIAHSFGNFLALLGAIAVSMYITFGKKLREKFSIIPYIFFVYAFSGIILAIIALIAKQNLFNYDRKTYFIFFLIALIPQVIGHTTYNWALKYLSAPFVAVSILGEPVFASIFAFLLLKETPSLLEIVGALVIMAGIYFSSRQELSLINS